MKLYKYKMVLKDGSSFTFCAHKLVIVHVKKRPIHIENGIYVKGELNFIFPEDKMDWNLDGAQETVVYLDEG